MDVTTLATQIDSIVRLRFRDGEEVEALVLAVDVDNDRDVTYDVRRILAAGKNDTGATRIGRAMVASLDDVAAWEPIAAP